MRRLKESVIATELPTALEQTLQSITDLKQDQMNARYKLRHESHRQ
jgi:hypothetical protein